MPQNRSSCWEYCDFVRKGVIRCKFCHKNLSNNITRFKNHLIYRCNAPEEVKKRISAIPEKTIQAVQNALLASQSNTSSPSPTIVSPSPAKKKCILISDVNGQTQQIELLQDNVVIEDSKSISSRATAEAPTVLLVKNDYLISNDASTSALSQSPSISHSNNDLLFRSSTSRKSMSEDRLELLQKKFCRAMFESRCSFNLFESRYWHDFFNDISLDFKIPTNREIEGKYLDRIYVEIQNGINSLMADSNKLSILLDQSVDNSGRTVLHVFLCSNKPFFYKTLIPNGNFQCSTIEPLLEQLFNDLGIQRVVAVVAKTFESIASPQFQEKFKPIVFYRCCAHQLRLMAIEVIEVGYFKNVLEKALHLIACIRNDPTARNKFRLLRNFHCRDAKIRKFSLKNFVNEPFFCPATTYRNLIKSKNILLQLLNEDVNLDSDAHETIEDDKFWASLQSHCDFFSEISEVIRSISYFDSCFSDVVYFMNNLRERLNSLLSEYEQNGESECVSIVKDLFKSRYNQIVCNSAVLSYILHPRLRLEGLRSQQIQEAELFLDQMLTDLTDEEKEEIITGYHAYFLKSDLFNNPLYWKYEIKDPINWWRRILKSKVHEKLAQFAIELLSIKPTVFSIDRSSRLNCTRLSEEKQNQLNVIANHLRINSGENEADLLDEYESGSSDAEDQNAINETSYLLGLSQQVPANGQEPYQYYLSISVDGQECQE